MAGRYSALGLVLRCQEAGPAGKEDRRDFSIDDGQTRGLPLAGQCSGTGKRDRALDDSLSRFDLDCGTAADTRRDVDQRPHGKFGGHRGRDEQTHSIGSNGWHCVGKIRSLTKPAALAPNGFCRVSCEQWDVTVARSASERARLPSRLRFRASVNSQSERTTREKPFGASGASGRW